MNLNDKNILNSLFRQGGKCVNLGRVIKAKHPELHDMIINETSFIDELARYVSFNERIYCILNGLIEIQYNAFGDIAEFGNIHSGYSYNIEKYNRHIKSVNRKKLHDLDIIRSKHNKKTKLENFKLRNRSRNEYLYRDGMVKDVDYIICPVSNQRMSMIKSNYIENVLGMTVNEYNILYPGIKKISERRMDNVKTGLRAINPENGLAPKDIAAQKTKNILLQHGEDGLTGYERKGLKTKETHMNNVDGLGRNGYSQLAATATMTKASKGLITPSSNQSRFAGYKALVLYITNKSRARVTEGYKVGLAGKYDSWQLDHMYSIFRGFHDNISPLIIGHICNLKMEPWRDNISKGSRCSIQFEELLQHTSYTHQESRDEFDKIMDIIDIGININVPITGAYLIERLYETSI